MSKEPQCSDAAPQSTVQDDQTQTEDDQLSISEVHRSFENMLSTQDEAELRRIATEVSIDLDTHGAPQLDPNSKEFDLNKWLSLFVRNANDPGIKMRRAGVCFRDLTVSGSGPALGIQETVLSSILAPLRRHESLRSRKGKKILNDFNGVLREGELLVVLGRPGSGCSTFLKSICGELHGLTLDKASVIHYNGIPQDQMLKEFKGEVIYNQEVDKHFPHLTVGQTLEFAASARAPSQRQRSLSRSEWVKIMTSVVMATFGLRHTYNTKVGSDFVRGVSGGERKRVSIAEMALAAAPLASWDNSTRGLDSATALEFIKSLRLASKLTGSTHSVAIYQASQSIYDQFDKATVLYEGRQIFFGRVQDAKKFFEDQGWYCPPRQTTGDFLTSVTNPVERRPRLGMEKKVPRTPEEFEQYWRKSSAFRDLQVDQDEYDKEYPVDGTMRLHFQESKRDQQARHTNPNSSYLLSIPMQVRLNTKRAYQRIWNDITSTVTTVVSQVVMALIIGSVFYGTPDATQGFASKNATLFFAILLNALIAISEINSLYAQRPIIEKHHSYAFYHPFTEAVAGIVADIPVKFCLAVAFNVILYFMTNLDRTPGKFFLYFLIVFISMFVMSALFRTLAAITKGISQAMALAGVVVLALAVYTGFVIPVPYMHPWFKWIHYINPIFYAFEILMANEYHGRHFTCSGFIPPYPVLEGDSFVCSSNGAIAGQRTVLGDNYIATFGYSYSHVWRNFGILCAFLCGFMAIYFIATEVNSSTTSTAEVLVFQRGRVPAQVKNDNRVSDDEEFSAPTGTMQLENAGDDTDAIPAQTSIFTWKDVVYDIRIKDEQRRLLDHVSGWVKPGTLTALMGASGAGKTTLLDVLAQRASIGVITGEMFVNGMPLDQSFQRNTGYVQQQDLHLQTSTVRESLQFSAMLRQPDTVSKAEKYAHVESVIRMLGMESFADAVVGIPGQGLNVEQRKLLSIGVELAAKPKLLIFLDEPTSGLDSQSSWSICAFLRKLADSGQAILCTIHQPSATLFEQFDQLLFLAKGGKTVYFGDIGKHSRTLLGYFESNGARQCRDDENPAEYILEIVETTVDGKDWNATWKESEECLAVYEEIDRIHQSAQMHAAEDEYTVQTASEFATPFWQQLCLVSQRVFQQYWRMPYYIWAKLGLGMSSGLFIGFSAYNSPNSLQGMQNVIFSVFMVTTIFSVLVQQIMPLFITQRSLYEVRERASKMYSWKAFLIANISVEIPYQIFLGILVFGCYYYAVNGIQSSARQGLVLLYCIQFFIFGSSFAHMLVAGLPDAETAGAVTTLLFSLILVFNGVMQVPSALPGFWIFMYRVSPFTYWVAGIVGTILHDRPVQCSSAEFSVFNPPSNQTCGEYLGEFLKVAPGYLDNPTATAGCQYCSLRVSDQYLAGSEIYWTDRGRNFGLGWAYIFFNIFMAVVLYWALRVKRWSLPGLKKFQRPRTPTTAKRSNKKEESF